MRSASFIITTDSPQIHRAWSDALPSAAVPIRDFQSLRRLLEDDRAGARVWIRDATFRMAGTVIPDSAVVVVLIGEPGTIPFEEARGSVHCHIALSYAEARSGLLKRILPLVSDSAASRAIAAFEASRHRAILPSTLTPPENLRPPGGDLESLEAAIGYLEDRTRVVAEISKGLRVRVRASRVSIFIREHGHFRAIDDGLECPIDDGWCDWLRDHSAIVDPPVLIGSLDATTAEMVERRSRQWRARLIFPFEVHGDLGGWIVLGARSDGQAYNQADKDECLAMARFLARLIEQSRRFSTALHDQSENNLVRASGLQFAIVRPGDDYPEMPIEASEVLTDAISNGKPRERDIGSLRVFSGPAKSGAFWVAWIQSELSESIRAKQREADRWLDMHRLGILVSHEAGNATTSLYMILQHLDHPERLIGQERLVATIARDIKRLRDLPQTLSMLAEMPKSSPRPVDLTALIRSVAEQMSATADIDEPISPIVGHEEPLGKAILWLCEEVISTRRAASESNGAKRLEISLRQRGNDPSEYIWLISIATAGLQMEQLIDGAPTDASQYPTLNVFVAREVIRCHGGRVVRGQGLNTPEVQIELRGGLFAEMKQDVGRSLPLSGINIPTKSGSLHDNGIK